MLTLTDDATMQIRNIIDSPGAPEGCGVRIATDPASGALSLALAATPAEDDKILDEAGARVFLEPQAAVLLDVVRAAGAPVICETPEAGLASDIQWLQARVG